MQARFRRLSASRVETTLTLILIPTSGSISLTLNLAHFKMQWHWAVECVLTRAGVIRARPQSDQNHFLPWSEPLYPHFRQRYVKHRKELMGSLPLGLLNRLGADCVAPNKVVLEFARALMQRVALVTDSTWEKLWLELQATAEHFLTQSCKQTQFYVESYRKVSLGLLKTQAEIKRLNVDFETSNGQATIKHIQFCDLQHRRGADL